MQEEKCTRPEIRTLERDQQRDPQYKCLSIRNLLPGSPPEKEGGKQQTGCNEKNYCFRQCLRKSLNIINKA